MKSRLLNVTHQLLDNLGLVLPAQWRHVVVHEKRQQLRIEPLLRGRSGLGWFRKGNDPERRINSMH